MQGLAASLRLPASPLPAAQQEGDATDGVLLRLLALRKGRALLARILSLLAPPTQVRPPPGLPLFLDVLV